MQHCGNCQKPTAEESQDFCAYCGARFVLPEKKHPVELDAVPTYEPKFAEAVKLGMTWYRLVIYFYLFAIAVGCVCASVFCPLYGDSINAIFGVSNIALALFCVLTRFRLADFASDAPRKLNYVHIWLAASAALRLFADFGTETASLCSDLCLSVLAGATVALVLNIEYFSKRAALFADGSKTAAHRAYICGECGWIYTDGNADFCVKCGTRLYFAEEPVTEKQSLCKYAEKIDDTHIKCLKTGTYRKFSKACPCADFEERWYNKLKKRIFDSFK